VSAGAHPRGDVDRSPEAARLLEVADGIFAYVQPDGSWWINNTGFFVGGQGVVTVDTCSTERRTRAYLRAIASVTDRPVRTVINTHHHGDHTFGNHLFPGATIVAQDRARAAAIAWGKPFSLPVWTEVDWGEVELDPPFLTFSEGVTLHVDDRACDVRYIGTHAHTTNDSIVWVPGERVLFSGDLVFNGGTPFLLQGSVRGVLDAIATLRALQPRVIVPGHGGVCGPEALDRVEAYARFVLDVAERGRAAGLSPLDAAREADLGEFAELLDAERLVGNLHRAYAEADGGEPDPTAAITDMITYNGGQPLRCYA
jgi:cyclase